MSNVQNQTYQVWQDVAESLRRVHYQLADNCSGIGSSICCNTAKRSTDQLVDRHPDKAASVRSRVIADGYALMLMTWSDMISTPLKHDQLRNLCHILARVPVLTVVKCLKEADSFLVDVIQREKIPPFSAFKQHFSKRYPECAGLLNCTRGLWDELCNTDSRSQPAKALHTIFSFITRLNIPDRKELNEEAQRKFLEHENEMDPSAIIRDGDRVISLRTQYTAEEAFILSEWFPAHVTEKLHNDWVPKHGKGAVSDAKGVELLAKYQALGIDDQLFALDIFTGGPAFCRPRKRIIRKAKVVFVPKSVDKLRTICMEPATLMFYQQGYMSAIVKYINSHSYLGTRITLDKAYLNTNLAREGSIDGQLSTIDLSNASDSVSLSLVRKWFSHTALLDILMETRSNEYFFSDPEMARVAKKFAPMGSALCFPVECLVFAAMCEATIRASGGDPKTSKFHVYGDDIIIETCYAEALIQRLKANGFQVNTGKSFYHVTPYNFRESCGGEYLSGCDITPFRISRKFSGFDVGNSYSRWTALVDLANQSFLWLPTVRGFVISELMKLPQRFRPFFTDDWAQTYNEFGELEYVVSERGGLVTFDASNYRIRKRKSENLHGRVFFEHGAAKAPKGVFSAADEDIRFYEYLRSTCRASEYMRDGQPYFLKDYPEHTVSCLTHTPTKRSVEHQILGSTWSRSVDAETRPRLGNTLFGDLFDLGDYPEADWWGLHSIFHELYHESDWFDTLDFDDM